jgi:hypothetical protein
MAKRDDIPKTDPSEIEALIQRLKQSNIEPRDAQLVERLLRLALSMASLLQHKNASIKRLKRPGHGRMAASAYTGAKVVICRHPDFKAADHCPYLLCRGHLYPVSSPAIFIQLTFFPRVN